MAKKACKISKDGIDKDNEKKFLKIIKNAKYYCKKCGRVAAEKENLCKPEKI